MANRRSRFAAPILALLTAVSLWLSLGTVAVTSGDTHRIAALPSFWILIALVLTALGAVYAIRLRVEDAWPLALSLLVWLPFLPGDVPAAFLIWQGPAEAFVWLVIAVGLLAAHRLPVPQLVRDPHRAPWIAGAIVALACGAAFSQARSVAPGGDEPHYLAATQSILQDFDLRVANNYANGDYLDYFPGRLEPHFLQRSTSGEIYSIHAPGVSIVVLPAFVIAGYPGAAAMMILIAAVTAAIAWRLAWRVSSSVAGAWTGVAAVFATTPYFFHAFTIYPEIIGSLCVMCGAWLLIELEDGDVPTAVLIASGASLSILPWLHSRFAILAGVLGFAVLLRLAARPSAPINIAKFLSVPVIAGASWFAFFWLIWGSPSPTAPYGADTSTSVSYVLRGLIGLLVDQQFGVLTTAPIYLVTIAGMLALARQRVRLAIELSLTVGLYAIAVATYAMWWAGSAAPARFLVAVLPLAALPIAMSFRGGTSSPPRVPIVALMLLVISMGLVVPRVLVESGRFIFNNRGSFDATLEWLSQTVDLPLAFPSVHRDGGSIAVRDTVIWIALALAVQALVSRLASRALAPRWAVASLALGIAAMIGASTVWSLRDAPIVTPDRSKLATIDAFRSWHNVLVDVSALRAMGEGGFLDALTFDVPSARRRINRLPAGEFKISASQRGGSVSMFVGRNDPPIESPQADDLRDDRASFRLRLPVALQSLNFGGNGEIPEAGNWLKITPINLWRPSVSRNATRAMRYGHARAFFFDDWAYPERDGIWTRANGLAQIVIDTDAGAKQSGLPISITAGAAATTVRLSIGEWEESLALAAGQKQELTLPPAGDGTWPLSIRSGDGFRPSEREPGNRDVRSLAAWIAIH